MLGVYVHLPFCPYICPYCDFAKWPYRPSSARRYFDALCSEIEMQQVRQAATVFLGGGTPNAYSADAILSLLAALRERFPGPPDRETTIEINPDLINARDVSAYRESGITRLSIGVQSFDEAEVRTLGRRHTAADVASAVSFARDAGIPSISLDLIFGVPGQTMQSWRKSLDAALQLGVDHVSVYGLTVEENTPYAEWRRREPDAFMDDGSEAQLYELAIDTLERAGYEQYEISNFALPGHRCRHNENYWNNGEYVGLGVGAASYLDGKRSMHTRDLELYVASACARCAIPGEVEELQGEAKAGEAIMLALRTAQGLSFDAFKDRYGFDFISRYASVIERYRRDGLLELQPSALRLTRRGRLLANDVCAAFIAAE